MANVYAGPFCSYTLVPNNGALGLTINKAPAGYKTVITKVIVSGDRGTSQAVSIGIKVDNLSSQTGYGSGGSPGYFYGSSFAASTGAFSHTFDFGGPTGTDGGLPLNHTDSFHTVWVQNIGATVTTLTATVFYVWQKL